MIPASARARWGAITATRPGRRGARCSSTTSISIPSSARARWARRSMISMATPSTIPIWISWAARNISCGSSNGRPIGNRPDAARHAALGRHWKKATAETYQNAHERSEPQGSSYPVAAIISTWIPPIRIAYGRPLLRITFDFPDNDLRMSHYHVRPAGEDRQGA